MRADVSWAQDVISSPVGASGKQALPNQVIRQTAAGVTLKFDEDSTSDWNQQWAQPMMPTAHKLPPTTEACLQFSAVRAFASPDDVLLQRTGSVSRS